MGYDIADLLERRRQLMGSAYRLFYEEPVHIVRGEGVWLYDSDDKRYLDMYNNVPHVGHCHPRVVRAARDQMALLETNTRYLNELLGQYAGRLAATLPDPTETRILPSSPLAISRRVLPRACSSRSMVVGGMVAASWPATDISPNLISRA